MRWFMCVTRSYCKVVTQTTEELRFNRGIMRQSFTIEFFQAGICSIPRRYAWISNGPSNPDSGVTPQQAAFITGVVISADFIMNIGPFAQHAKSMCKSWRHVELSTCIVSQLNTKPMTKCGRRRPQIDDYVENDPSNHCH